MNMEQATSIRFYTGVFTFDQMTNGWKFPSMVLLSGGEDEYLTSSAITLSCNFLEQFKSELGVLYLSLKLEKTVLFDYFHKTYTYPPFGQEKDFRYEDEKADELKKSSLFIDDQKFISSNEIVDKIKQYNSNHKLGFVVIDFLQLANLDDIHASKALDEIAKELNLILLILVNKNQFYKPDLNIHFLDSPYPSLVAISDIVLYLERSHMEKKHDDTDDFSDFDGFSIYVIKNRYRGCGKTSFLYKKQAKFYDLCKCYKK